VPHRGIHRGEVNNWGQGSSSGRTDANCLNIWSTGARAHAARQFAPKRVIPYDSMATKSACTDRMH
jgi:hypothetical protein